jgi:hypothetical protein
LERDANTVKSSKEEEKSTLFAKQTQSTIRGKADENQSVKRAKNAKVHF